MRRAAVVALWATLVAALVACGSTGSSTGSPAASGAGCAGDVKAAGTYPDLEALLPKGMTERSPDTVDSGVNCTATALGTYASHGLAAIRFAGATWDYSNGNATVVAILARRAPDAAPLDEAWVEEFYTAGALAAKHTEDIKTTRPTMPGAGPVFRLEALNDLSLQTVVIWATAPYVHVVIVATTVEPNASRAAHDQRVETAVQVAAAVPIP